jgi:6-phosphofructokinase 1
MCGEAAVRAVFEDASGVMVTLKREPGPAYAVSTDLVPLERVAFVERLFPVEWRSPSGNDIRQQFLDYALPLTGEIPPHERLSPYRPQ